MPFSQSIDALATTPHITIVAGAFPLYWHSCLCQLSFSSTKTIMGHRIHDIMGRPNSHPGLLTAMPFCNAKLS
jgi:hypothetical protein